MELLSIINEKHIILQCFNRLINKYWLVKNKETHEEYYLINCANSFTIVDIYSIDKIILLNKTLNLVNNPTH